MSARPSLWWLEAGQAPAWRLADLARNFHEIRLALRDHPPSLPHRRQLRAAARWHRDQLAAHAYRIGLDRDAGPVAEVPLSVDADPRTRPAVWLDDAAAEGPAEP